MELGFIGLGRMGMPMVERMLKGGLRVVVWNRSQDKVAKAVAAGAVGAASVAELVGKLEQERRVVWLMLPAGEVTERVFQEVLGLLKKDDIIIDGANSQFEDTLRRHELAAAKNIGMLDVGVSGGIVAATRGYPMMIGGGEEVFSFCKPIFESIGFPDGWGLVGKGGAGHYVKMVHNAIEYGMMQAISEGFDLLKNGRFPNLDLRQVAQLWNHGTIIESFLMRMTEQALAKRGDLADIAPYVADSGEGRWSIIEATRYGVPFLVNTAAVFERFNSQTCGSSFAFKLLAAIRNEFGGHAVKNAPFTQKET
ncbi:decarboxylating 6-phosphogluconate dehydrogenase [Candidatus Woesearchaeota archaeon]|nr:MAG: decarboxylating 6-phosphogluconate dehydrogenase [Candidatus Woesearchaeota archaeon]